MEQGLIGLHRFWPVQDRATVLSFDEQLLFLGKMLRADPGLLGLGARLASVAQMPPGSESAE